MTKHTQDQFGAYFVSCLRDGRLKTETQIIAAMTEFGQSLGMDDAEIERELISNAERVRDAQADEE